MYIYNIYIYIYTQFHCVLNDTNFSSAFCCALGRFSPISSKNKNIIPMYTYFQQFLIIKNYHRNKLFKNLI